MFRRFGFPVSSSKSRGGFPINKAVKPFIFPIKRSQAASRSRGSLAFKYSFQIRSATYILTGSPVRYFFARKSPETCSSPGCFQRLECSASLNGIRPKRFHSPSGSCSKAESIAPKGRVASHSTSASVYPCKRNLICSSSPIRIRSFIFCLSRVSTSRIRS